MGIVSVGATARWAGEGACSSRGGTSGTNDSLAPSSKLGRGRRPSLRAAFMPACGTLAPRGSFEGETTAHTDGVALHAASTLAFPNGALFAVHDDKSVTAFDLRDVAKTLSLEQDCTQ